MKKCCFSFLLLAFTTIFSQNEAKSDSIIASKHSKFIKDYTNQFNVKVEVSNDIPTFKIPFQNRSVAIEPNLNLKYALVLSYKFASIRLGIRPNKSATSQDEKGDPKTFRIKFKLLFDKWSHHFEYNQVKGYYIIDSGTLNNDETDDIHLQFPDLKTKILSITTAYKLNDKYSVRATISQTEVQLKSVGSFIPSITYSWYNIGGLDNYLDYDGNPVSREHYSDNTGFTGSLNLGYHYTFVYRKWYASAFVIPGIGFDFRKVTEYSSKPTIKTNHNALLLSVNIGAGIGYNTEKIFFGTAFNQLNRDYKHSDNLVEFQAVKNAFFVFFGYRFNAPKTIAKPIDNLEDKLPFIK